MLRNSYLRLARLVLDKQSHQGNTRIHTLRFNVAFRRGGNRRSWTHHCCFCSTIPRPNVGTKEAVNNVENEEKNWQGVTLRLLAEQWNSPVDWEDARRTLDWWIQKEGGTKFIVKLLEKTSEEAKRNQDGSVDVRKTLNGKRTRAFVEKWAGEFENQRGDAILDPSDLMILLESFRNYVDFDPSVLEIIHGMTRRHRTTPGRFGGEDAADRLLPVLAYVDCSGDTEALPDRVTIDSLLRKEVEAIAPENVGQWAQNVLDTMWSINHKYQWANVRPDFSNYHSVLKAWMLSNVPNRSSRMKKLVEEMETLSKEGTQGLVPNARHFTLLLSAHAKDGDFEEATKLLQRLNNCYRSTGMKGYKPTGEMYGIFMAELSKSSDPKVLMLADMLRKELFETNACCRGDIVRPPMTFWSSYIKILSIMGGTKEYMEKAEAVLDDVLANRGKKHRGKKHPNVQLYGQVIRGWSQLKEPQRAEKLLLHLCDKYYMGKMPGKPDPRIFLDVTNAWANSDYPQANDRIRRLNGMMTSMHRNKARSRYPGLIKMLSDADASKAEVLLRDILRQEKKEAANSKLTRDHFQAVISAWSKVKSEDAALKAENILSDMLKRYDSGDANCRPSEHGFTSVISAFARGGRKDCGDRAQIVFDEMKKRFESGEDDLRPSVRSYTALMNAWAAAGEPERAEDVLKQMGADFYNGNNSAKPSIISFNTVLSAWSKRTSPLILERVMEILGFLKELGESDPKLLPDAFTYAAAISCCIRSDSPLRVNLSQCLLEEARQRYLNGQESCKPNSIMYGAVIQTIARAENDDSAEKAEAYLKDMLTLHDFDPKQVLHSHTVIMTAWSRNRNKILALEKAEGLVRSLIALSKNHRTNRCLPGKFTYAQLLSILSNCEVPDKKARAETILKEMESFGVEADEVIDKIVHKIRAAENSI